MTETDAYCMSSFLTYRYVVEPGHFWRRGVAAPYPEAGEFNQVAVANAGQIVAALRTELDATDPERTGLLLSAGIDSAILAALLPEGTWAYTIRFVPPRPGDPVIDEAPAAAAFAAQAGLRHRVVDVTWADYEASMDTLMRHKGAPLHPVEPGLYRAACVARQDGLDTLVVGNGADSTFGGLDKLLCRDWTFSELVVRYTFVDPVAVLRRPVDVSGGFTAHRRGDSIDVMSFLEHTHGIGIMQAFDNALGAAGCRALAPYEALTLGVPLDLDRIRGGESKYLLREVFRQLHPDTEVPDKIAFARPMDRWMADWAGPTRPELRHDLRPEDYSGEQRWLIAVLERFLALLDRWEGQPEDGR